MRFEKRREKCEFTNVDREAITGEVGKGSINEFAMFEIFKVSEETYFCPPSRRAITIERKREKHYDPV